MPQQSQNNSDLINNMRSSPVFAMMSKQMQQFFTDYYKSASKDQVASAHEAINASNERLQKFSTDNPDFMKDQQEIVNLTAEAKQLSKQAEMASLSIKANLQQTKDESETEKILDQLN